MSLCSLSSCFREFLLVEGHVSEHGEECVGTAAGEGYEGLVVTFGFGAFPVVVGPGRRVFQCGERGEEQRTFEDFVAFS